MSEIRGPMLPKVRFSATLGQEPQVELALDFEVDRHRGQNDRQDDGNGHPCTTPEPPRSRRRSHQNPTLPRPARAALPA